MKLAGQPRHTGIGVWNDAPERTHVDVMWLFRRALVAYASEQMGQAA
jgi:hypothetical protein